MLVRQTLLALEDAGLSCGVEVVPKRGAPFANSRTVLSTRFSFHRYATRAVTSVVFARISVPMLVSRTLLAHEDAGLTCRVVCVPKQVAGIWFTNHGSMSRAICAIDRRPPRATACI